MNTVVPLKDKRSINKMKKSLRKGRYGERNVLIFSMGINTAYRISDLRNLKLSDVAIIEENKIVIKNRLSLKEQKTGKYNSVILSDQLREELEIYINKNFTEYVNNDELEHYLFPSGKEVLSEKKEDMQIAPSSLFQFPIYYEKQAMKAGKYTLTMTVRSEKQEWQLKNSFTITEEKATALNKTDVSEKEESRNVQWLVLGLVGIIFLLLIILIVVLRKKR